MAIEFAQSTNVDPSPKLSSDRRASILEMVAEYQMTSGGPMGFSAGEGRPIITVAVLKTKGGFDLMVFEETEREGGRRTARPATIHSYLSDGHEEAAYPPRGSRPESADEILRALEVQLPSRFRDRCNGEPAGRISHWSGHGSFPEEMA